MKIKSIKNAIKWPTVCRSDSLSVWLYTVFTVCGHSPAGLYPVPLPVSVLVAAAQSGPIPVDKSRCQREGRHKIKTKYVQMCVCVCVCTQTVEQRHPMTFGWHKLIRSLYDFIKCCLRRCPAVAFRWDRERGRGFWWKIKKCWADGSLSIYLNLFCTILAEKTGCQVRFVLLCEFVEKNHTKITVNIEVDLSVPRRDLHIHTHA